jgi:DNA adenine methylase
MKPISLLKYPGGKTRAVHILEKFVPPGTTCIYSPFFGGGSFEIYCAQQKGIRVVGNDKFEPLVNFWRCIAKDASAVHREVQGLLPVSKDKFARYLESYTAIRNLFKRAALFYVLNRCSFNGKLQNFSSVPLSQAVVGRIKSFVFNIDVSNMDFIDFVRGVPKKDKSVLVYVDPPYMTEQHHYGWKGCMHKSFDHKGLSTLLNKISKDVCWLLSYNDCPVVRDYYKNHTIHRVSWTTSMKYSNQQKKIRVRSDQAEIVILSRALQGVL